MPISVICPTVRLPVTGGDGSSASTMADASARADILRLTVAETAVKMRDRPDIVSRPLFRVRVFEQFSVVGREGLEPPTR